MIYGIQRLFGELGEAACYFICLVITAARLKKEDEDIWLLRTPELFLKAVDAGLVHYDPQNKDDPNNCLVLNTDKLMKFLLDGGFSVSYTVKDSLYLPSSDEVVIEKWKWQNKNTMYTHFVMPDFDPLGTSNTRTFGYCVEKRVFKVT